MKIDIEFGATLNTKPVVFKLKRFVIHYILKYSCYMNLSSYGNIAREGVYTRLATPLSTPK